MAIFTLILELYNLTTLDFLLSVLVSDLVELLVGLLTLLGFFMLLVMLLVGLRVLLFLVFFLVLLMIELLSETPPSRESIKSSSNNPFLEADRDFLIDNFGATVFGGNGEPSKAKISSSSTALISGCITDVGWIKVGAVAGAVTETGTVDDANCLVKSCLSCIILFC